MKKIISILLVIVMCISLSSCVMQSEMKILEDGQIEMSTKTTCSETELNKIVEYLNANIGKEIEIMGETQVLDEDTVVEMEAYIDAFKLNANEEVVGDETYYSEEESASVDYSDLLITGNAFIKITPTEFLTYSYVFEAMSSDDITSELTSMIGIDPNLYKEITGVDVVYESTIKMPYKIVRTNATLIDDYTVDGINTPDNRIIYIVTEKADESLINAENIEATITQMAKEDVLNSRAPTPYVSFISKTGVKIEFDFSKYDRHEVEYKVNGGEWKLYKTTDKFFCKVKNLKAGKKYSFRVTGILETDEFGTLRSKTSKVVTKNFADFNAPKFTLSSLKKGFKVSFSKRPSENYQVKYSKNKNMKKAKTAWVYSKTQNIKGLKAKTTYYVQVRKSVDWVNGDWSKAKKIKTK